MAGFTTQQCTGILGGLLRFVVAKQTITTGGHVADLDTGLATILGAWTQVISDNPTTATEVAYVTVDHGADGLLDLYTWQDDIATEAATATDVYVLVIGY